MRTRIVKLAVDHDPPTHNKAKTTVNLGKITVTRVDPPSRFLLTPCTHL